MICKYFLVKSHEEKEEIWPKVAHRYSEVTGENVAHILLRSEEPHSWVDSLPFEIPFGLATTFKSDEDWLDDWEEVNQVIKKPYTFDDRVDDYRLY